jgi:ComF family protein
MRLPFIPVDGCCRRCGCDVHRLDGEFLCEDCRVHRPRFDRSASALRFEGDARKMLVDFKFNRHLWLRDDFTDWLEAAARARFKVEEIDLVLPVPMKFFRRIDRGYNQCGILASALSRRLGIPAAGRILRRTGSPARQSSLSEDERRENVKGTFLVRNAQAVSGKTVLMVDDVMTTGSTLSECAGVLKEAGCERVWCLTLMRS